MENKTDSMTAEEYVAYAIQQKKDYYKKPEALIDEMIRLLEQIKTTVNDEDKRWRLGTAVSEAYHVVLWDFKNKQAGRLINTILSFLENGTV